MAPKVQSAVAFVSLLTVFTAPLAALAQQPGPALLTVTLVTGERGIVGTKWMASKDIVAHVTALRGSRTGMHIVTIQTCPGVPPDTIQAMMKDFEARRFMVAIDFKDADPLLCRH